MNQEEQFGNQETLVSNPMVWDNNMQMFQLENEKVLEDMEHNLRREKFNTTAGVWEKNTTISPMLSDEGIYTLLSLARPHMDKNFHLSTFTEQQIYSMMRQLEVDVVWNIRNNWTKYGISNGSDADLIVNIIIHPVFAAVKRAQEAATLNMFSNTQRMEQRLVQPERKKSWFSFSG